MRYVSFPGDHENMDVSALRKKAGIPAQMGKLNVYEALQGLVMDVYDREIVIGRLDFGAQAPLGPDWVIPLDSARRPYETSARRRTSVAPQFPKGSNVRAKVVASKGKDGTERSRIVVEFPLARPLTMR